MNTLKSPLSGGFGGGRILNYGDETGGYKVVSQLGAGGMGQVYLVENIQMHKKYALKVLPPNLSGNRNFIDRFRVEARVMADLKHPNIVGVHNIGHDDSRRLFYLVMEYISSIKNEELGIMNDGEKEKGRVSCPQLTGKGGSLRTGTPYPSDLEGLLKEKKKLQEDYVLKITKQLCSALDYAHNFRGKGIVHRDLKPSNILLDSEGNAHIADFGLAKVIGSDYLKSMIDRSIQLSMMTNIEMSIGNMNTIVEDPDGSQQTGYSSQTTNNSAGSLIGTYEYMAPEQQEGGEATMQSDIYSLGLIIYRMLTGVKAKGRFKLPSEMGLSSRWDEIIHKSLEPEPADRFDSVSEIVDLLDFKLSSTKSSKSTKKINNKKEKSDKKSFFFKWLIAIIIISCLSIGSWFGYQKYDEIQKAKASAERISRLEKEKQQNITQLTSLMNSAFNSEKYSEASEYANRLLAVNPGNSNGKAMIQQVIERADYKETAPVKIKCEYAVKNIESMVFTDGMSKEQNELKNTLKQNLDTGNQFFKDKEYKSAMKYYQKVLASSDSIKQIEKSYTEALGVGEKYLSDKQPADALEAFQLAFKSKESSNAEKFIQQSENMIEFRKYMTEGNKALKEENWINAEAAFKNALSVTGYSNDTAAKTGIKTAHDRLELIKKKAEALKEFSSVKEYITSSGFYGRSDVSRSEGKEALKYCNNSLLKLLELEKNYSEFLASPNTSELNSLKSKINNLKSNIKLLPSDLKEVVNASYPFIYGLASGSSQAQSEQKSAVAETGLSVEVETAKYGIKMRLIPSGSFMMGSPSSEDKRDKDEVLHRVTISKPFYIGMYEVTQKQWEEVMGNNPSKFKNAGSNAPVEQVSWEDCQMFLNKLCDRLGVPRGTYRLPTEAQWEYACRAGTSTPFYFGSSFDSSMANFDGHFPYGGASMRIYREKTLPVGSFKPNAFGLYDTAGNVWEWCNDWYGDYSSGSQTDPAGLGSGSDHVERGGGWNGNARGCRSADRVRSVASFRLCNLGFRLLRTIPDKK